MRYSTLAPGKRIRGVLAVAGCEAGGKPGDRALPLAAAIEMVHAYSLIHDDLPAMDDDDWRRGQPSCHRAFGEGMAILAGDALQTLAFQVLGTLAQRSGIRADTALEVISSLGAAAGSLGMAGGQAEDLDAASGSPREVRDVEAIHRMKTAALIRCAVVTGAMVGLDLGVAGRSHPLVQAMERYGEHLGLAFQILDDLMDAPSDRPAASYPAVAGEEGARRAARRLTEEAVDAVRPLQANGAMLEALAWFLYGRQV